MVTSSNAHPQNAHAQNAHKGCGLLRPPNAATLAVQWSQAAMHTRKMHTRVPAYSGRQCSNIGSAVVTSSNAHTQNAHTQNAHKLSGLLRPPQCGNISSAVVTSSNARTQNAHKRSGLLRPPNAATLAVQWSQAAMHRRKMHTSVPVYSGPPMRQH